MSFLDIGSINRIASERNVRPHPLVDSLQLAAKTGYVNALAIAAFTGTGEIQKPVVESVRKVAIALGLSPTDGGDAITTIRGLSDSGERNRFFVEAIDSLPSHEAALYYICDFIRLLSDGQESKDLLSAVLGLLKNRISDQDISFINEYTPYLRCENIRNVAKPVRNLAAVDFVANAALLDYFTPGWNDEVVKLPVQPQVRICDGKFFAGGMVQIGAQYDVALRNAEIEFARDASIYIVRNKRSIIDVSNCAFVCCDASKKSSWHSGAHFISTAGGNEHRLIIHDCIFTGRESAWALFSDSEVMVERCKFVDIGLRNNCGSGSNAFWAKSLVCKDCIFENCATTGEALFRAEDIILENCKFIGCHTKGRFFYWSGGARKFEIRRTKFGDCSTKSDLIYCEGDWNLTKDFGFYDCEFERFVYQGLCDKEMVTEKMNKGFVAFG